VVQGVTDWHKAGMPIDQIVVGTPFYGHNMTSIKSMAKNAGTHEYDPVQGGNTGHNCIGGGFSTETGWQDIIPYLYENRTTAIPPWVRKFDTITRTPWLTNSETNEFIS
jgi:GH18 family chitinase